MADLKLTCASGHEPVEMTKSDDDYALGGGPSPIKVGKSYSCPTCHASVLETADLNAVRLYPPK